MRPEDLSSGDPNYICPSYHSAYHTRALDAHMLRAREIRTRVRTDRPWLKGVCVHATRCGMQRDAHPLILIPNARLIPISFYVTHFVIITYYRILILLSYNIELLEIINYFQ